MNPSKDIQRDEYYLPGHLGYLIINGKPEKVVKIISDKENTTLTISPNIRTLDFQKTEDAEFEVIPLKQLT